MAHGKPSPGDLQNAQRPAKTSPRVQGSTKAAPVRTNGRAPPVDDGMEGLFVDAAPQSGQLAPSSAGPRPSGRAADRRRERGKAPPSIGVPDTKTALPQRGAEATDDSALSELHPRGLAQAQLLCTRGPEEGLSLALIEGSYTIGRARENSFVLKDIAASRQHLRIEVGRRGARAVDLGSGNGTRVNGKRIGNHWLKHGDRIEIGASVLQFQEVGNGAASVSLSDEDVQDRVIRAAEKLAAELARRVRPEVASQSGSEDAHVIKTQALPQAKVEKLWKETFTNVPLDKVVPADEPLRGPRAVAASAVALPQRALLPRPAPLTAIPAEQSDVSRSIDRGGSFWRQVLVTTLVVLIAGSGVVIGLKWLLRSDTENRLTQEEAQQEYGRAMEKCSAAFATADWFRSFEYATVALQLRPGDEVARTYQRDARARLDQQRAPPPAPEPAPLPAPLPAPVGESSAAPPLPPAAPVAVTIPEQAPTPPPAPRDPPGRTSPRAPTRSAMSDAVAQQKFTDGVDAIKAKNTDKGCQLFQEIANKVRPDSRWRAKVDDIMSRRCD